MTTPTGGTAARRAAREAVATTSSKGKPMSKSASASARRRELDPDALAALEEERDFLLRSLEDLEREHAAGDVDDSDFEELKDDYTARAAAAIRAIEDRTAAVKSLLPQRNWQRTALGLVLVGALAVGASWLVFRNAGTRAPGQGLTGDIRQDSSNLILQAQGLTGQAQASLQAGDSTKALKQFESAVQAYDKALEISPENVQAMTYRGWVLHTIALSSELSVAADLDRQALEYLDEAIAIDPLYSDARVFRAILERNAGEFGAAKADLDAIDMNAIPMYMIQMVNSLREDVAAGRRD
ncbi:Tetratricopeptide repeat [Acidimicrobiia bacterium]